VVSSLGARQLLTGALAPLSVPWELDVAGALVAVVLLWIVPYRRTACTVNPTNRGGQAPILTRVGGGSWFASWWPIGASWPLVQLDVFRWGIRMGPHYRWMRWLLPSTEFEWSEIVAARRLRGGLRIRGGSAPVKRLTFVVPGQRHDPELDGLLRSFGVPLEG
jgi:hypothetical protein